MAQYEVVPFVATIANNEGITVAAGQLQALINSRAAAGWRYLRLESVEIIKAGTNGCFGLGATPSTVTRFDMAVFER
jgi:hypothetical protein